MYTERLQIVGELIGTLVQFFIGQLFCTSCDRDRIRCRRGLLRHNLWKTYFRGKFLPGGVPCCQLSPVMLRQVVGILSNLSLHHHTSNP